MILDRFLSDKKTIWYLMGLALLCRLVLVLMTDPYGNDTLDGIDYHNHAIALLNGDGYPNRGSLPFMRPPLYPILLSIVYFFVPHESFLTARLVNIVLDIAACYVFYKLILLIWNSGPTALIASLVYAVNPLVLFFCIRVRVEALFTLLVVTGVYLLVREYKTGFENLATIILIGIIFGLSILCRSNGTPFLILIPIWLVFARWRSWRRALIVAAVFVIGCVLVVAPWSIRNYYSFGEPVLVTDGFGYAFWISNTELKFDDLYARTHDEYVAADAKLWRSLAAVEEDIKGLTAKQRDDHYFRLAIEYVNEDWGRWIWLNVLKTAEFWSPMARYDMQGWKAFLTLPFGLIVYFGLFVYFRSFFSGDFDRKIWFLILVLILVSMGTGVLTWSSIRFRVPLVDPYVIPFGINWLLNRFKLGNSQIA
jgi:hypothetical protein